MRYQTHRLGRDIALWISDELNARHVCSDVQSVHRRE
jgi:predicted  nucleic acid-binding Zn ribbon protein